MEDSESAANQSCPSPNYHLFWIWEYQSQVLLEVRWHSWGAGLWQERWVEVDSSCGWRRKREHLNWRDFLVIAAHQVHHHATLKPVQASLMSDLPSPKNAKVKYSVIDGTLWLSIATNRTHTWTLIAFRTWAVLGIQLIVSRVYDWD